MASTHDTGNRVRLRIAGIELQPNILERTIKAELHIGGKVVKELPVIDKGQPLKWSSLMICDVYSGSPVELVICQRHHGIYSRFVSDSCLVSDITKSLAKKLHIEIEDMQCTADIITLEQAKAEELFDKGRETLVKMDQTSGTPERLASAQRMFKSMLQFGSIVAEAHPIAKMVFAVCTAAWERVEEQQKLGEELDDLASKLVGMAPLVDEVKKHARLEPLLQNIAEFLHLIEDVSIFVLERKPRGFVVRVLKSMVDSTERDQAEELVKRFQKTNREFQKGISVQTMAVVMTAREDELIQRLNPVEPSGHDPSRACQDGTRLRVLADIDDWIQDPNPNSPFLWIYGQAGIGKSTILVSVCNRLSERRTPTVSFFCKRDDPALRDPLRLVNSVAYGLAIRCPAYGKLVAQAIEANKDLCTSYLGIRYDGLLKKPLEALGDVSTPFYCVVIVDAMDECGDEHSRRQLLEYLHSLPVLSSWLRIIVTSRPDSDIRGFFNQLADKLQPVSQRDLQSYPAKEDIRAFFQKSIGGIAVEENWPLDSIDRLCTKAEELFIWAATACKFIINGNDSEVRLRQVLDGNLSTGRFDGLDALYMAVITNSMADQAADNVLDVRRCIGAIVTISMRQPVPIDVLCSLMQEHMKPAVLRKVVGHLGAVLYSDLHLEGAVRVLHPSFADFVLEESRSGRFWVDPMQRNIELSVGCMRTMERELRFNICELGTSHLPNNEVPGMETAIEANISGQLAYSCIYWISHLLDVTERAPVELAGKVINEPRLLYWLEVLSLLQRVDVALHGLRKLSQWLKSRQVTDTTSVWDAYRFVFAFFDSITTSAPHIYVSALAFAPKCSEIYQRLSPLFPNTATVAEGNEEWPKWLRSMSHSAGVNKLCVSQDGQLLVTSCNDDSVRMFDLRTGGLLHILRHPSAHRSHEPAAVAISASGSSIAAASFSGELQLWNANTGSMTYIIPANHRVHHDCRPQAREIVFSSNEETIYVFFKSSSINPLFYLIAWDKKSNTVDRIKTYKGTDIGDARISPDGNCVAIVYRNCISLQPKEGATLDLGITGRPEIIVFSPDGSLLASYSIFSRPRVNVWDVHTGAAVGEPLIGNPIGIYSIAFSWDGTKIVTGSRDRKVKIWDTKTGRLIGGPFLGHSELVGSVAFSPDDTCIISGSEDNMLLIWDTATDNLTDVSTPIKVEPGSVAGIQRETIIIEHSGDESATRHDCHPFGHSDNVCSVSFSPCGTQIISASEAMTIRTWDAQAGTSVGEPRFAGERMEFVAFSLDGSRIMAGATYASVCVWDVTADEPTFTQDTDGVFAFSHDGNLLVGTTGDPNTPSERMVIWNTFTGDTMGKIDEAIPNILFAAFSSDSRLYSYHHAGFEPEGKVYIWDIANTFSMVGSWAVRHDSYWEFLCLCPHGSRLTFVDTYDSSIVICDLNVGSMANKVLHGHTGYVTSVAFSPDGTRMASGSWDRTIRLWDVTTGTPILGPITAHLGSICSVAFSSDGTRLVSGSDDKTIRVWDMNRTDTPDLWDSDTIHWPSNTILFPPHPTYPDWLSHDQKSLTIWLPGQYRRAYDPRTLLCISADPRTSPVHIDFSRFVHGTAWTSVIGEATLLDRDRHDSINPHNQT